MDYRPWSVATLLIVVGCAAPSPPSSGPAAAPRPDSPADRFDEIPPPSEASCETDLEPELTRLGVPGISAAIVRGSATLCTAVAGMADIEQNRPVTPDTVFAWASVSKTVTAVTLMTLFEQGSFALDDDIAPSLPFAVVIPTCPDVPITFRHLLTHTSSIIEDEDDDDSPYPSSYGLGDSQVGLGEFLESYLTPEGAHYDAEDNFEEACPGTVATYSNVATGLAGFLGERLASTPFDQLAASRVFAPLGMTETSFRLADLAASNVAMPYTTDASGFTPVGHIGYPTYPDGMLRTSVPSLARFLSMFIGGGELEGTRILDAATIDEMQRIQNPAVDDGQGLIWYFEDFGVHHVMGHDGEDPGTRAFMYFDPATGNGVLLVANGEWNEDAAKTLMATLFDEASRR